MISNITAVILADGKNTRLQMEKSLLEIDGSPLIDYQVLLLQSIFFRVMISSSKEALKIKFPQLKFVQDEYQCCGPLAGIQAAMKAADTEAVFVFACDMPFLNRDLILKLVNAYQNSRADILVPRHQDGIEPLHAIYSTANLPYLEKSLASGDYSVRSFYRETKTAFYDLSADYIKFFYNINTHSDLSSLI
jgi:molybdopterin-guanine dinucleotide biosynthesis protein A